MGSAERNALQYLSASIGLANMVELLDRLPADDLDGRAMIHSLSINDLLSVSPVIYASGLTAEDLEAHMDQLTGSERLIGQCIGLLRLHKRTGLDPMEISNRVLSEGRLTAGQWLAVTN